jgi:hypothetical protein
VTAHKRPLVFVAFQIIRVLQGSDRASRSCEERDLVTELEAALASASMPLTCPELARAVTARDKNVREALAGDSRFKLVAPPPERSPKAKTWALVPTRDGLVPGGGTSARSEAADKR